MSAEIINTFTSHFFEYGHTLGEFSLERNVNISQILPPGSDESLAGSFNEHVVFLDTETSGLDVYTGTFVFLVGLGFYRQDGIEVIQLFLRDPGEEANFLAQLSELLKGSRLIITFNGKQFDLPLLKNRIILNRKKDFISPLLHVDLLPYARRFWKHRLARRNLQILEKEILHFFRPNDDIPGWLIPSVYFEYLTHGSHPLMSTIFSHNVFDILSLIGVGQVMAEMLAQPLTSPYVIPVDLPAIGDFYEVMQRVGDAEALYQRVTDENGYEEILALCASRYAKMLSKRREWVRCESLWQICATVEDFQAIVELAKYYEHQEKDLQKALNYARLACKICQKKDYQYLIDKKPRRGTSGSIKSQRNLVEGVIPISKTFEIIWG